MNVTGSLHGGQHFARVQGGKEQGREQYRKAARIALDTSAHAGSEYQNFVRLSTDKVSHDWGTVSAIGIVKDC